MLGRALEPVLLLEDLRGCGLVEAFVVGWGARVWVGDDATARLGHLYSFTEPPQHGDMSLFSPRYRSWLLLHHIFVVNIEAILGS